jgi:predicted HAD superfamily Cof-like phosphohydrolase
MLPELQNNRPTLSFAHAIVAFNRQILKIEPRPLGPLEGGELDATIKAFDEELTEFKDAVASGDFIGQIDALTDLKYFIDGALYKMGLTADQINDVNMAVHDANMQKKLGIVEKRGNPLGDAVKPEGWVSPEERIGKILGE